MLVLRYNEAVLPEPEPADKKGEEVSLRGVVPVDDGVANSLEPRRPWLLGACSWRNGEPAIAHSRLGLDCPYIVVDT